MKKIASFKYRRLVMWCLAIIGAIGSEVFLVKTLGERFGSGFYYTPSNFKPQSVDVDSIGSIIIWIVKQILKNFV